MSWLGLSSSGEILKALLGAVVGSLFFVPFPLFVLLVLPRPVALILVALMAVLWVGAVMFFASFAFRFAIAAGATGTALLLGIGFGVIGVGFVLEPLLPVSFPSLAGQPDWFVTGVTALLVGILFIVWLGVASLWVIRTAGSEDYTWGGVTRGYALGRYAELGGLTLYEQDRSLKEMQGKEDEFEQDRPLFDDREGKR